MPIEKISFKSEKAPCGQTVSGRRHLDEDEECVLTDSVLYARGCRVVRHDYHDGTCSRSVVRHDGKVLVDRMNYHA